MKKHIVKTPYGDVWMNPPYLSAEYMDNDAGIMRAWVARIEVEKWYDEHPEFGSKNRDAIDAREKIFNERMKVVVEEARRAKSRG